jgi:HSP20 family molecular chaperone IbpA
MDPQQQFAKWSRLARQFLGEDFWADMSETLPTDQTNRPPVDVYHGKDDVLVLIEIPGIQDLSQIGLRVEGRFLHLRGEIPPRATHYRAVLRERNTGSFERKVDLGVAVQRQYHRARYRRGVIELLLKKERGTRAESPSIRVSED